MTWLTTPERKIKWTHDAVIEESHKYEYKCDFRNISGGTHQVASEKGWLKEERLEVRIIMPNTTNGLKK